MAGETLVNRIRHSIRSNSLNGFDFIPVGTFLAGEYTPDRISAIHRAISRGHEFLRTDAERIAEMYRKGNTQLEIAQFLDPQYAKKWPDQAEVAIGYVVRKLIPRDERLIITSERSRKQLMENLGGKGSEKYLQHQREASKQRHNQGIPVDADAMIRGRGFTPWTAEERQFVFELLDQSKDYKKPDLQLIAEIINEIYHENQPVWNAKKVYDMVRYEEKRRSK